MLPRLQTIFMSRLELVIFSKNKKHYIKLTEKQLNSCELDSSKSSSVNDSDEIENGCHHFATVYPAQHYGSFYLRMGAVAFGIGSMIYSGLEFGQYFELEQNTKCHNIMLALTPSTRMAFIFVQMYFIFLNNEVSARLKDL